MSNKWNWPERRRDQAKEPTSEGTCPRCGGPASGDFYGPCQNCCTELRSGDTVRAGVLPPAPEPSVTPHRAAEGSAVLRRAQRRHRARATVYRETTPAVADLLHGLPAGTERVYLCGPRPGLTAAGDRAWYLGQLPEGWAHHEAGHYLGGQAPVGKYLDPSGRRVEVHRAASWLGEGDYSPAEAEAAMVEVGQLLGRHPLLATPATTGRELLVRTIPERADGWPCLSDEHQDLIRSTSGQGRMELFTRGEDRTLPGLYEYDGRFMYAGLCRQLGAGPAELVMGPAPFDPYARARYYVTATVPARWSGPGLLGEMDDAGGWSYPSRPGEQVRAWCDGSELQLAQRYGWSFHIEGRLVLADSKADPLGGWAGRIVKMRQAAELPLAGKAIRRMLLMTIGTLHGRPHQVTKVVGLDQAHTVPDEAPAELLGSQLAYEVPTGQAWPELAHPEWTAAIWARGRTRLLSGPGNTGALHLDEGEVVAMRTDALYVTHRQRAWERTDDGKPGRLQYRGGRSEALAAPAKLAELLAARTWKDQ